MSKKVIIPLNGYHVGGGCIEEITVNIGFEEMKELYGNDVTVTVIYNNEVYQCKPFTGDDSGDRYYGFGDNGGQFSFWVDGWGEWTARVNGDVGGFIQIGAYIDGEDDGIYIPEFKVRGCEYYEPFGSYYGSAITNGYAQWLKDYLKPTSYGDIFKLIVVFDGKQYVTEALFSIPGEGSIGQGLECFYIGNLGMMESILLDPGQPDTGEPFGLFITNDADLGCSLFTSFEGREHTVSLMEVSEPVSRVIESKGDGYALYNGVKLPSLPEYDTETYPYMVILKTSKSYVAYGFPLAPTFSIEEDGEYYHFSLDSLPFQYFKCTKSFTKNTWGSLYFYENSIGEDMSFVGNVFWSNFDLINITDNSVYLATSEPIPLDSMNVIEWDGDTQGLEPFPRSSDFLFVSDTTDVDTNKEWIGVITFRDGAGSVVRRGTPSERDGCWVRTLVASYVPTATADSPTAGLYIYGTDLRYVSLFAYYPIETGGDEEPAETVSYIKFLCSPSFYYLPKNVFGWKLAQKRGGGFPVTPPINVLITLDGYILQDKNGLYIIPKED